MKKKVLFTMLVSILLGCGGGSKGSKASLKDVQPEEVSFTFLHKAGKMECTIRYRSPFTCDNTTIKLMANDNGLTRNYEKTGEKLTEGSHQTVILIDSVDTPNGDPSRGDWKFTLSCES